MVSDRGAGSWVDASASDRAPSRPAPPAGIDRTRVEDMEARLKADVLREAANYDGCVLVAHEAADFQARRWGETGRPGGGLDPDPPNPRHHANTLLSSLQVMDEWEAVTEADVQTPSELFAELADDGYAVDYVRVPVTDEKAPKDADFAALLARAWRPPHGAALVFNCQMGRGRTTTGMAIASLVLLRRASAAGLTLPLTPAPGLPPWWCAAAATTRPTPPGADAALLAGRYGVVRSLLRALPGGDAAKACLDAVLDAGGAMQNLREAIAGYRARLAADPDDDKRSALLDVALEYLERYCALIMFAAYLAGPGADPESGAHVAFAAWTRARPELRSVLARLLRRNPLAALELHTDGSGAVAGASPDRRARLAGDSDDEAGDDLDAAAALVAARAGGVLGPATILKDDHYPGCQTPGLPLLAPGAPNFRGAPGAAVFGGGTPTRAGVRAVLAAVSAAAGGLDPSSPILWVNMREEVCLHVNGRPHVLREAGRPFKNMREYVGISPRRLEAMEARLKADALAEAGAHGGRLLVAREEEARGSADGGDPGAVDAARRSGRVADCWELVDGPAAVATPRDVFEAVAADAWPGLRYVRLPLTDGATPRPAAVDALLAAVAAAGPGAPVVITCQMGGGRTTMGMAVACLARRLLNGGGVGVPPATPAAGVVPALGLSGLGSMDDALPPYPLSSWADLGSPRGARGAAARDDGRSPRGYAIGGESGSRGAPPAPPWSADDEPGGRAPGGDVGGAPPDAAAADGDASEPPDGAPPPAEAAALAAGDYEGVRRLTVLLDDGAAAKADADGEVDRCDGVVSLRRAIARYRKPRRTFRFYRPELHARHAAFTRGATYLERYCVLIALASYLRDPRARALEAVGGGADGSPLPPPASPAPRKSFAAWLAARPDVTGAMDSIRANPAAALTPVARAPAPPPSPRGAPPGASPPGAPGAATDADAAAVLGARCGSTLTRGSILKAARAPGAPLDARSADGAPVTTIGSPTYAELEVLLTSLGAGPGGARTAVVTDLREELTLYVSGAPASRRERARPAAALHHAGVRAGRLEELEARLMEEAAAEAAARGGRLLLHVEAPPPPSAAAAAATPPLPVPGRGSGGSGGGLGPPRTSGASPPPPLPPSATEDVTIELDAAAPIAPGAAVATWARAGAARDAAAGLATPRGVAAGLRAAGFRLLYARVPLSRDRTPQAADVDALAAQADAGRGAAGGAAVHVVVARGATGSSARFAAVVLAGALAPGGGASGSGWTDASSGADTPDFGSSPSAGGWLAAAAAGRPARGPRAPGSPAAGAWPPPPAALAPAPAPGAPGRAAALGQYRAILNLVRALPRGRSAKAAADAAVDACASVGDLRDDIVRCKVAAEEGGGGGGVAPARTPASAAAARRLGLHYLQRYFYAIAFLAFRAEPAAGGGRGDGERERGPRGGGAPRSFADWFADRRELRHLLASLSFDTVV